MGGRGHGYSDRGARLAVGVHERLAVGAERRADDAGVVLGIRAGIGRFEIDDVAKEDLSLVQFVAPDDDGLEGQRAFAETRDHRLAAGLDALGNRDFALARQQLDGAHLAQIHAHGIVGALARLALLDLGDGLLRDLDQLVLGLVVGAFVLFLVAVEVVGLGNVDAHVREHRHDVLDLLGRGLVAWQHFVELIEGHEATLLGLLDHLLDGGVRQVEQRRRRVGKILLGSVRCLVVFFLVLDLQRLCLRGHSMLSKTRSMRGASPRRMFFCCVFFVASITTQQGRRKPSPPPNLSSIRFVTSDSGVVLSLA